jgi:tetratricopeptide (TPR) repeat protein
LPFLEYALAGTPANLPHVHALRGKAYAALGRTNEAIAEYKQALVADHRGSYHYQLYRVYLRAGEQENAQAMLKQVKARIGQ